MPRPQSILHLGFKPRFSGFSLNLFVESKRTGEMELLLGSNLHSTHWQVCNFICIFDSSYQLLLSTKLGSSTYPLLVGPRSHQGLVTKQLFFLPQTPQGLFVSGP